MNTGERIKAARKAAKISQSELGDILGVSQAMISAYEMGVRNPKLETLSKIADALGILTSDLLDGNIFSIENPPTTEYVQGLGEFLYYNPNHKVLFDSSMEVKKEDVNLAKAMLDRINGKYNKDTE